MRREVITEYETRKIGYLLLIKGAISVDRKKPNPLDAHFLQDFNDVGTKPQSTPITPEEKTEGKKNNLM